MPLKKSVLRNSRLYLILDKTTCGKKNLKHLLEKTLQGGADIVQFRDKFSPAKKMIRQARPLLALCHKYHVPFIVNDRLEVALRVNADGLHIGQEDVAPSLAREILGKNKIIGLSCHSAKDVKEAQKEKVDYLGFGPVFATATKPEAAPKGVRAFLKARRYSRQPIFAIGGIKESNLGKLSVSEETRVAVCREILHAKNITEKTRRLKSRLL